MSSRGESGAASQLSAATPGELGQQEHPGFRMGRAVQEPAYFQPRNHLRSASPSRATPQWQRPKPRPAGCGPFKAVGAGRAVLSVSAPHATPGSPAERPEPRVPAADPAGPGGSRLGGARSPARPTTNPSGTAGPRGDRPRRGTRRGGPRAPLIALRAPTFPAPAPQSARARAPSPGGAARPRPPGPCSPGAAAEPERDRERGPRGAWSRAGPCGTPAGRPCWSCSPPRCSRCSAGCCSPRAAGGGGGRPGTGARDPLQRPSPGGPCGSWECGARC